MAIKFEHLEDTKKYKKALKAQVKALGPEPCDFRYFEKFRFKDGTLGSLMLVGEMAKKSLFDAVKNTNALIVAKGQCAAGAGGIEFAPNFGKLKLIPTLKADMGNPAGAAVVKELSTATAPAPLDDSKLEARAKAKLVLLTKQFDSIKGRMMDEERKGLRIRFGKIQDLMGAGKYGDAIKEMAATEKEAARIGSEIRADQAKGGADQKFLAADELAAESRKRLADLEQQIAALEEEIKSSSQKASVASKKRGKRSQEAAKQHLENVAKAEKQLKELQGTITSLAKDAGADKKVAKALLKEFLELQAKLAGVAKTAKEPGRISDDPDLKEAQAKISGKVEEMGEAAEWQKGELKDDKKHGTGRHGSQTGVEKQARRLSSDVTPDQEHNPSGTAQRTAKWKTTIKWEEKEKGKRVVKEKAKVVQTVIDELNNTFGASKSSIFLNPVVEKEAVDRAKAIAKSQCEWTEWKDGATWKPLLNLTIVVPPPKSSLGYGYAVERTAGFVKKSATDAANAVKRFEDGKITIDDLLKVLDVQLKTDRTGIGAAMVRHARVVLTRDSVNADWSNKTQFPTDDPLAWEAAKNKSLNGKQVRSPTIPATTAPLYTP